MKHVAYVLYNSKTEKYWHDSSEHANDCGPVDDLTGSDYVATFFYKGVAEDLLEGWQQDKEYWNELNSELDGELGNLKDWKVCQATIDIKLKG